MIIERQTINGDIQKISIAFETGSSYKLISQGASLTRWKSNDGTDIVAGYQDYDDYKEAGMYLGTCIGMTAGRIAFGKCVVAGKAIHFQSKSKHFLHGGDQGLNFINFEVDSVRQENDTAVVEFSTTVKPKVFGGLASIKITYLINNNGFRLNFDVSTRNTILCNLTNHSYFNLDGDFSYGLNNHKLQVNASKAVMVDENILGTDIIDVKGSVFDFKKDKSLAKALKENYFFGHPAKGLDHFFILDDHEKPAIILTSKKSQRVLEVKTSYPGVTLYTTNYPTIKILQNGQAMAFHGAIAIEPQYQSNAVNDHRFENYLLQPEGIYSHFIDYRLRGE